MILTIIKILLLAFTIARFEPKRWILDPIIEYNNHPILKIPLLLIYGLVDCFKCASFWTGLLISHNIYISCSTFLIAMIYDKYFSRWEKTKIN